MGNVGSGSETDHEPADFGMAIGKGVPKSGDLSNLPLIRNKYQPLKVLGYGAFGYVLKIMDMKTAQLYAMKFFCLEVKNSYLTKEEQRDMIDSGIKELELLRTFSKHSEHIVKYIESFVINRSPLNDVQDTPYLCLVIEFCNGGNLNTLLTKYQKLQKKLPRELVLKWFLNLLKTLKTLHVEYKILHRDLKPDNLLFVLHSDKESDEGESFQVDEIKQIKICDFGVGKMVKEGEFAREIKGHLFFTSPEVLKPTKHVIEKGGYDSRCDVYSLGIIFFQMYKSISQQKYEDVIINFESMAREFGEEEKEGEEVERDASDYYRIVTTAHEHNYVIRTIQKNTRDVGVKAVLENMICAFKNRFFAKDLLDFDVIRTWDFLIMDNKSELSQYSMIGALTCLRIENNTEVFLKSLDLTTKLLENPKHFKEFIDKKGVRIICENLSTIEPKEMKSLCLKMSIKVFIKIIKLTKGKGDFETLRKMGIYMRRYQLIDILKETVLKEDLLELYLFCILLFDSSRSIVFLFFDSMIDLMFKITDKNSELIVKMLEFMVPVMKSEEIYQFLEEYAKTGSYDIYFLKLLPAKDEKSIVDFIFGKIWENLEYYVNYKNEKKIVELLKLIIFMSYNFTNFLDERKHNFSLSFSLQPSINCGLGIINKKEFKDKVLIDPQISTRFFIFKGGIHEDDTVELMSDEPICVFKYSDKGVEKAIGFFEMFVKEASYNDEMIFGFQDEKDREVLVYCTRGLVTYAGQKIEIPKIYCTSGTITGVGITNRGRVFVTYNNRLVKFIQILGVEDENTHYFSLIKIKHTQKNLKGYINYGKRKFMFTFQNDNKPTLTINQNSLGQFKANKDYVAKIGKQFSHSKEIGLLSSKLLNFRSFQIKKNPPLIKEYKNINIMKLAREKFGIVLEKRSHL